MPAKDRISAQIQRQSLKDALQVEYTITATFQHFYAIIEPLNETAGVSISKVICDTVQVLRQELEKSIKAGYSTFLDSDDPMLQVHDRFGLRVGHFEYACQRFTKCIRLAQTGCGGK